LHKSKLSCTFEFILLNQKTHTMQTNYKNHTIEIVQDEDSLNPRIDCDNLGTMICFHNRYDLGDRKHGYNKNNYSSWSELEAAIVKNEKTAIILPLYLYDHGGITIATEPFDCRWDSGQIGFIFISKDKALSEYGGKIVTKKLKEKLEKYLISEVGVYDQYLTGEVYRFTIFDNEGIEIDSCGSWFGGEEIAMREAENIVDSLVESK
jgi:hypothetical protein